ncbi:hypothetical protein PV08_06163 [Exophiala spinifera]|uniref:Uncharacterized protein n=1 Tax=Exophiala spinifera TaxID=91928 RepID=A0A0D1ZTK8_9EURO|nr:uncharacterized protein PV08_06163 [Exophiala spinifera]KIW16112.1 hypothetical protein PV08_06163 [Exophiala spinifera]
MTRGSLVFGKHGIFTFVLKATAVFICGGSSLRLELKRRRRTRLHRTHIDLTIDSDEDPAARKVRVKHEIKNEEPPKVAMLTQQINPGTQHITEQEITGNTAVVTTDAPATTIIGPSTTSAAPLPFRPTTPTVRESYHFVNVTSSPQPRKIVFSTPVTSHSPDISHGNATSPETTGSLDSSRPARTHPSHKCTLETSSDATKYKHNSPQSTSTKATNPTSSPKATLKTRRTRRTKSPREMVHNYWLSLRYYFKNETGLTLPQGAAFEKLTRTYSLKYGRDSDAETPEELHKRFDYRVERDGGKYDELPPTLRQDLAWVSSFCHVWWPAYKSIPRQEELERLIEKVIHDIKKGSYNEEDYHEIASTGRIP